MAISASVLPELIDGPGELTLRRWTATDAPHLERAVTESVEHLRPWMPWAAEEPIGLRRRRQMIAGWEADWAEGGDVLMGIFLAGQIAGGCGLHRRIGPGGLEIGYWVHPAFLRRGLATGAAGLLAATTLDRPDISHVEIHHDKANHASAGVPRKLDFTLVAEVDEEPQAPAEIGVEWRWRLGAGAVLG
ncbi:MAG: GNAT family N-acetyltransferase [Solirubrobacteraceae bacterium]